MHAGMSIVWAQLWTMFIVISSFLELTRHCMLTLHKMVVLTNFNLILSQNICRNWSSHHQAWVQSQGRQLQGAGNGLIWCRKLLGGGHPFSLPFWLLQHPTPPHHHPAPQTHLKEVTARLPPCRQKDSVGIQFWSSWKKSQRGLWPGREDRRKERKNG